MELGQYEAVMVGTWWYWVSVGRYWLVLVLLLCDLIVIDVSLVEHLNIGQIASNWRSAFHPAMIIIEPSVQSSMLVRC